MKYRGRLERIALVKYTKNLQNARDHSLTSIKSQHKSIFKELLVESLAVQKNSMADEQYVKDMSLRNGQKIIQQRPDVGPFTDQSTIQRSFI